MSLAALPTVHLGGHSGPVYAVDLAPDNQHLLSASGDRTVRLWNLELQVPQPFRCFYWSCQVFRLLSRSPVLHLQRGCHIQCCLSGCACWRRANWLG